MFLSKFSGLKNCIVNYRQVESLCKSFKPAFSASLSSSNTTPSVTCITTKQVETSPTAETAAPQVKTSTPANCATAPSQPLQTVPSQPVKATVQPVQAPNGDTPSTTGTDCPPEAAAKGKTSNGDTATQGQISKGGMEVCMTVCLKEGTKFTQYEVKTVPDSYAQLGESPHWDPERASLYYVDLNAGKLLRYDFNEKKIYKSKIREAEGSTFVIPVHNEENKFIVGSKRNVELIIWDGLGQRSCINKTLFSVQNNDLKFIENRFNDAKCDKMGRLYAGTMYAGNNEFDHRFGELYMYDGERVKTLLGNLGISNGMTWNKKGDIFYFIDMADYNVKQYKFDKETGCLDDPKVVYNWKKTATVQHILIPDGMTIDTEGNLYVAVFNGGTIYKINPSTGELLMEIKLPCKQITSCAFGGPSMDILFVTTSSKFHEPPPAGMLFQVTGLDAQGLPMHSFKLNNDKDKEKDTKKSESQCLPMNSFKLNNDKDKDKKQSESDDKKQIDC